MLGNGRLEAFCMDGVKRLCHIRGKMRKKVWVNTGDVVLVGLREYQDEKADVILKCVMGGRAATGGRGGRMAADEGRAGLRRDSGVLGRAACPDPNPALSAGTWPTRPGPSRPTASCPTAVSRPPARLPGPAAPHACPAPWRPRSRPGPDPAPRPLQSA